VYNPAAVVVKLIVYVDRVIPTLAVLLEVFDIGDPCVY
jgi:hypothetical protein